MSKPDFEQRWRSPIPRQKGVGAHRAVYLRATTQRDEFARDVIGWAERYPRQVLVELAKQSGNFGNLARAALRYLNKLPEEKK